MRYYRRIFSLLLTISISFILLISVIFFLAVSVKFRKDYQHQSELTANQLALYTDRQLSTAQLRTFIVTASGHMQRFVTDSPPVNYNRYKLFEYFSKVYNITPSLQVRMAIVFYERDYVILNDYTCDLELFLSLFYITRGQMEAIRTFFAENPLEKSYYLPVLAPGNQKFLVYVQCEQTSYPQPVYFFNLFSESSFFDLHNLNGGSLLFSYRGKPVHFVGPSVAGFEKRSGIKVEQPSNLFGHSYTYYAPKKSPVSIYLLLIFFISIATIFAVSGIMYIVTQKLYRPIEDLLELAHKPPEGSDEFAHIRKTLIELYGNVAEMSGSIEKYHTTLENFFFIELMTGYIPEENVNGHLQEFRLVPLKVPVCAIVIACNRDKSEYSGFSKKEIYLLKQNLISVLDSVLSDFSFYRLIDMDYDTVVLVIEAENTVPACDILKETLLRHESVYALEFTAAVGVFCPSLGQLSVSYRSARRLLETSRYFIPHEKVLFDTETANLRKKTVYYSLNTEQALINAVINRKRDMRAAMLDEIFSGLSSDDSGIPQLSLMLTATIQRIIENQQKLRETFCREDFFSYAELASCPDDKALRQKIEHIFDSIDKELQNGQNSVNPVLLDSMLSFIHTEYVRDICLDDLAETVHLSANYASTVFKNAVGINFKEYLNRYRYTQACRIITEDPHLRIKEVAAAVGCNTEILARLFIRYSGMLPTDFQHRLSAEKNS